MFQLNILLNLFKKDGVFSFTGRINRSKYIIRSLVFLLMCIGNMFLMLGTFHLLGDKPISWIIVIAVGFFIILYSLANSIKRLHDLNLSGLWILLWVVLIGLISNFLGFSTAKLTNNIISFIIWVIMISLPGTPGPNKYGEDPLATTHPTT
ncbi:DUF805 domain-containing protein [Propionispora vibrioides]|nr:DUF805 domain-containing protein [Propionispora vibrioides]